MRRSIRRFIIPHGNLPGLRTYADLSVQISPVGGGGGECVQMFHPSSVLDCQIFLEKEKSASVTSYSLTKL